MNYRLILLAAASATTLMANAAFAQETAAADVTVEEVVVTGSRAPRTRLDTVSPVDVVTAKEMAQQATTETAQALANIAPSITFPRPSITDGTDSVRPATLRGLAPDQTLVLVNGVRQHGSALVNINGSIGRGSAAVDLNTIPMAALSTVEVLRDGASAQYGSDAIAGVINLRLREARDGGNITAHVGGYFTDVRPARIPQGYKKQDGLTLELSGWKGYALPADGFLTVSAELRSRQPTSRSDLDPREPSNPLQIRSRYGDAETQDATLFINTGWNLNSTWQGYGWLGINHRETESAATGRIPSNVNNSLAVYPNGFIPLIAPIINDVTSVLGARGEVAGYKVDFNAGYGFNHIHYRVKNSINGSLIPNSPTKFDAGQLDYSQFTLGLDVLKPLEFSSFKQTTLAFGAEFRNETYQIKAGDFASYGLGPRTGANIGPGAQGFTGLAPINAGSERRHSLSFYGDIDLQITDAFDIDVAARFEDYSDFGTTTTGKLAMRYDFTDSFAIRGAVSTGFRAPALQQSAFSSTAINFIPVGTPAVSTPFSVLTLRPESALAAAFGAQPLKAEESVNYSAGFVFHTGPFELTVDAYKILIDDRIVLSENLIGNANGTATEIAINNLLNPGGGSIIGGARFFINGVDSETKGVDIVGRYRLNTDSLGSFAFTLAANFNDTEITRVPAIPTGVPIPNPPSLFNRINVLSFEEGTPHTKIALGADWTGGPWGATVRGTYYESILHPFSNTNTALDVRTGDKVITDVEGRYRIGDNINWAVGVNNLFDVYPDATLPTINTSGALAWSNYTPFGFNGRFIYTRLSYGF